MVPIAVEIRTQTAVSSALPTIVHDLNGDDFVWVASAYALAATALQPAAGGMAQVALASAFLCPTLYSTSLVDIRTTRDSIVLLVSVCPWERVVRSGTGYGLVDCCTKYVLSLISLREVVNIPPSRSRCRWGSTPECRQHRDLGSCSPARTPVVQ